MIIFITFPLNRDCCSFLAINNLLGYIAANLYLFRNRALHKNADLQDLKDSCHCRIDLDLKDYHIFDFINKSVYCSLSKPPIAFTLSYFKTPTKYLKYFRFNQ